MCGTASQVRRWIIVEQPGPWGHDAVKASRLPGATARALEERTAALGARVILIRRHGRDEESPERSCYLAYTGPATGWVEQFTVRSPAELLELDLEPLARDERCGGRPVEKPLYLVCTNGRHDVCCAEFGRPLARALDQARSEQTWECSHIGGDRFAANLLCLPHGLYFGRVSPTSGLRIADRYEQGLIDLGHYRGRCGLTFLEQAAEHFARRRYALRRVDDLIYEGREWLGAGRFGVYFARSQGGHIRVELAVTREAAGQPLTCRADGPAYPPRYQPVDISAAPGPPATHRRDATPAGQGLTRPG